MKKYLLKVLLQKWPGSYDDAATTEDISDPMEAADMKEANLRLLKLLADIRAALENKGFRIRIN